MLGSVRRSSLHVLALFVGWQVWACVTLSLLVPSLPHVRRSLTLSQRSFIGGGSLCLSRAVPFPSFMCLGFFVSFYSDLLAVSLRLSSVLSPPAFPLHPSCCYRLHTCLTLSLLRLLPSSAVPVAVFPTFSCSRHLCPRFTSLLLFAGVLRSVARRLLACAGCRPGLLQAVMTCVFSVQFIREGQALSHCGC